MKPLLEMIEIDPSMPFIGRAAGRGVCRTLGFFVTTLVSNDIRKSQQGVPVVGVDPRKLQELQEKYGNTLDNRNEEDEASRGAAVEEQLREEQGFVVNEDPMVIAGKLNIIRLSINENLKKHAQRMVNPHDPKGGTFLNPYDIAEPLDAAFEKQLTREVRVNETMLRAQAEHIGIHVDDLIRITKANQEAGTRFLKANKTEILEKLAMLTARNSEGEEYGIEDAVDVEMSLPPIHRARMFVAADTGLWYERDRAIQMAMRGHPDGLGNMKLIDGARVELHKEFEYLMARDDWKRSITDAVQRGSKYPALLDLRLATPAQANGAQKAA